MGRWLVVLEAFARTSEWGVRDLAAHTGLSRSAVHRIVREMLDLGLLSVSPTPGRSVVGPALSALAIRLTEGSDVIRVARVSLDELRDETGETAILALYDRSRRQFRAVAASESAHPIRYIWESLQGWQDLHRGASGKGILAFLPGSEREAILDALPDQLDGAEVTTKARLRRQLEQARADGYLISHGDRYPGAVGVAAPIRDAGGRVIGEVLLGWPDNRNDPGKEASVARAAVSAALRISRALGQREGETI